MAFLRVRGAVAVTRYRNLLFYSVWMVVEQNDLPNWFTTILFDSATPPQTRPLISWPRLDACRCDLMACLNTLPQSTCPGGGVLAAEVLRQAARTSTWDRAHAPLFSMPGLDTMLFWMSRLHSGRAAHTPRLPGTACRLPMPAHLPYLPACLPASLPTTATIAAPTLRTQHTTATPPNR